MNYSDMAESSLVRWWLEDRLPFLLIESPGFCGFVKAVSKGLYEPPRRKKLRALVLSLFSHFAHLFSGSSHVQGRGWNDARVLQEGENLSLLHVGSVEVSRWPALPWHCDLIYY